MFKLNAEFDADSLLYLISHFECDSHTVHMLAQPHLLPPLTSTVKLSLFLHEHSSPFSLESVMEIVFIILTMAGLVPDRPYHLHIHRERAHMHYIHIHTSMHLLYMFVIFYAALEYKF